MHSGVGSTLPSGCHSEQQHHHTRLDDAQLDVVRLDVVRLDVARLDVARLKVSNAARWLGGIVAALSTLLNEVRPDGAVFNVPQLRWTQSAYMQPLMMPFDRAF